MITELLSFLVPFRALCRAFKNHDIKSCESPVIKNEVLSTTVKPVLSGHSKIDKTKILMTTCSLMNVESIAECSPWSILQYFWHALSDNQSWKTFFVFFLSGCLRQVLQYANHPYGLFAYWVIFHAFLSSADFFQNYFFFNSFRNTIWVSNSLDPDQARHYVGPDLDLNCLQRSSAYTSFACMMLHWKVFPTGMAILMLLLLVKTLCPKIPSNIQKYATFPSSINIRPPDRNK